MRGPVKTEVRDIKTQNKYIKVLVRIKFLIISISLVMFVPGCAVVSLDQTNNSGSGGSSGGSSFDASNYVTSIWAKQVIPYMNQHATDVKTVLQELESNSKQGEKKYGIQRNGSAWLFIVKGTGKVVSYNKNNGNGVATIAVRLNKGTYKFQLQTGPIIQGTTVRDSLTFVHYGNFENQIQFAEVSMALHKEIDETVLNKYHFDQMKNQDINFVGVLSLSPIASNQYILTPVELAKG